MRIFDYEVFCDENNEIVGFDIDMAQAASQKKWA